MSFLVVGFAAIVLFYFIATWRRGAQMFDVANSIILAAITYESFSPEQRRNADAILSKTLAANPGLAYSLEELWRPEREATRWRWYSIAFAFNEIWPTSDEPLSWAPPTNVFHEIRNVRKGLPDFEDKLARRDPYSTHLARLRRK
ncbi:MAG: hypothetical protein JNK40_04250 [Chromatiales bacterium]|nr:hypothetical protein [Chromatiales bacterium]